MPSKKKVLLAPAKLWVLVNSFGELWTDTAFGTFEKAVKHYEDFWGHKFDENKSGISIVRVEVREL